MQIQALFKKGEHLISENSTVILTAIGVVGTVTTAVLTGRASFKACEMLRVEKEINGEDSPMDWKEKVRIIWVPYIPPVGVGTVTIVCIVMANRLGTKKAAALATVYGLSERAFEEYKAKVVEKLGETKEQVIRDEIAQDRVNANPPKEIIITGGGEVLFMDSLTGRYFQSTVETIKKAVNKTNYDILNFNYASLSSFFIEIGLPPTSYSENVGWNMDHLLDVTFTTTLTPDSRPCVVMNYHIDPAGFYDRLNY